MNEAPAAVTDATRPAPVAVIDIGSNSIRLVIYKKLGRALTPCLNEKVICELGRHVARRGCLEAEGRACAMATLERFVAIARAAGCVLIDICATAAVRQALDGREFLDDARAAFDVEIDCLSGEEEARTAALGIESGFHRPRGTVGDLGGGSIEFFDLPERAEGEHFRHSLPIGALGIRATLDEGGPAAARAALEAALESLDGAVEPAGRGGTFYVVGGSWRALARARMAIEDAPLRVVHAYELTNAEARTLGRTIAGMSKDELARIPGVPRGRIALMPGAGLLFEKVVEWLRPVRVVFSAAGLREGRIHRHLDAPTQERDPLEAGVADYTAIDPRLEGIADAVWRFARPLIEEAIGGPMRVNEAACRLADTGWRDHPEMRARQAFFRLVQAPFPGIDHAERAFLGYTAFIRYGGAPDDPAIQGIRALMDEAAIRRAEAIGLLLDTALRLSCGVPAMLDRYALGLERRTLVLDAQATAPNEGVARRLRRLAQALDLDEPFFTVRQP